MTDKPNKATAGQDGKPEKEQSPERGKLLAKVAVGPTMRHATIVHAFAQPLVGSQPGTLADVVEEMGGRQKQTAAGERRFVSDLLTAQAITLDTIFTEMSHRAVTNLGHYPDAVEQYLRMALKAQANSRATLEALTRLHQPREQTVRHVHVNAGGQAVVADQFHHHSRGGRNAEIADQAHTYGAPLAALPGPNPLGETVPITGSEREEAVPYARRGEGKRGTNRQPKRVEARAQKPGGAGNAGVDAISGG